MNQELTQKIITRFPNIYSRYYLPETESLMCRGFQFDDGWFDIIWELSEDIEGIAIYLKFPQPQINEIKEKCSTLRIRLCNYDPSLDGGRIEKAIKRAQDKAKITCEKCGTFGTIAHNARWLRVLCQNHANETPIKMKQIHEPVWKIVKRNKGLKMTARTEKFKEWLGGFSAIDGGDIGSKENPSIWVCGIEWGTDKDEYKASADELTEAYYSKDIISPPLGFEHATNKKAWEDLISYNFGWQTTKLLAAINGEKVEDYRAFAERVEPFTKGSKGYFKLNLYPFAFKDTSHEHWKNSNMPEFTGIATKSEYLDIVKNVRFKNMRKWVQEYSPKLIICFGKSYINEFNLAFGERESKFAEVEIGNRTMSWTRLTNGTLLVILPFPSGRYGLNANSDIQIAGAEISKLLAK